ncbi:hypothetical protein D2C81_01640 [Helicobacter pylori]|nr:hypothetical protein D2C81_01640 [Helicobacter pylori]
MKKTPKNLKTQWHNGFDSKKAFLKTLFWILSYNFLPFFKTLDRIYRSSHAFKNKVYIYRVLSIRLCFLKSA